MWGKYDCATHYQIQNCELNCMFENIKCSVLFLQVQRNIIQFFSKDLFMNKEDRNLSV